MPKQRSKLRRKLVPCFGADQMLQLGRRTPHPGPLLTKLLYLIPVIALFPGDHRFFDAVFDLAEAVDKTSYHVFCFVVEVSFLAQAAHYFRCCAHMLITSLPYTVRIDHTTHDYQMPSISNETIECQGTRLLTPNATVKKLRDLRHVNRGEKNRGRAHDSYTT